VLHPPTRRRALLALVGVVGLTACAKNTGIVPALESEGAVRPQSAALVDDAAVPAAPVPGAKPGGTISVLNIADFEHLDPAQIYINWSQLASSLFSRTLTNYRQHPDGSYDLVGDLATNTGVSSEEDRTWTFTLRHGLRFEDGRPITSRDIAYGIARSFSPDLPNGPHYIQQWLVGDIDYNKEYQGPYNGGSPTPPGVETPDDTTIVFHFPAPHPDLPFAAAMPMTTPVPPDKDTRAQYDNRPFSSGPYTIAIYERGQRLVLVKNEHWDPATDPVRHQYPDTIRFVFGASGVQINERIISSRGEDAAALTWQTVPPEVLPGVLADSAVLARTVEGITPFNWFLDINTQRVKDVTVRRALNYAIDRRDLRKVWGYMISQPASTILSPTVSGYAPYDVYDGGPTGNVEKAKELLGGRTVPLVYAYSNSPVQQKMAAFIKSNLEKAGFEVTIQPVDADQWYTTVGKRDNPFDIYITGWGYDWPSGSTIIPPLFDGRAIAPAGNQNMSYFDAPEVNQAIDSISGISDLVRAGAAWSSLGKDIMTRYAPVVPLFYDRNFSLVGSRVGGAFLSTPMGATSLVDIFVK
jgi:peptide/nickel transport system substrate-binding protein